MFERICCEISLGILKPQEICILSWELAGITNFAHEFQSSEKETIYPKETTETSDTKKEDSDSGELNKYYQEVSSGSVSVDFDTMSYFLSLLDSLITHALFEKEKHAKKTGLVHCNSK